MSYKATQAAQKRLKNGRNSRRSTDRGAKRPGTQSVDKTSRDKLLRAAKRMFARKGLTGTSIRDIANEADMNSSQISYYFNGKEGLYRACIEDIAEERIQMAEQILQPPESRDEFKVRLRLFVENLFLSFLEDRDKGLIIIREHDRMHSPAEDIFKSYFSRHYNCLTLFFKKAIQKKFAVGTDPIVTTSLFFGMIVSELRFDHIKYALFSRSLKTNSERALVIDSIVTLFSH